MPPKRLSIAWYKPWIGVNHVEAHLYAAIMSQEKEVGMPCLGLVLSGGHTALVHMRDIGTYQLIGQTVDDAIGEAFDKVAKILGLPYPGGPEIERLALKGDPTRYPFKAGKVKGKPFDFSFSGLKTGVLYAAKGQSSNYHSPSLIAEEDKKHLAASFQQAAFEDVIAKAQLAAKEYGCASVVLGGGVTNNRYLQSLFALRCPQLQCVWPSLGLSLDRLRLSCLSKTRRRRQPISRTYDGDAVLGLPRI